MQDDHLTLGFGHEFRSDYELATGELVVLGSGETLLLYACHVENICLSQCLLQAAHLHLVIVQTAQ